MDPARCMVLLLQSRRIRFRALERDASWLHRFLPSKAEVRASSPTHPLPPKARMALLVVPVLDAQVNNLLTPITPIINVLLRPLNDPLHTSNTSYTPSKQPFFTSPNNLFTSSVPGGRKETVVWLLPQGSRRARSRPLHRV